MIAAWRQTFALFQRAHVVESSLINDETFELRLYETQLGTQREKVNFLNKLSSRFESRELIFYLIKYLSF